MTRLAYQDRAHKYLLDGRPIPSVTTITGILDKPALAPAAARETALWAAIHARELVEDGLPEAEWVEACKGAHRKVWNVSRDNGTMLHAAVMPMLRGEPMPLSVDLYGRETPVPDEVRDMATQAARFMDAWDVSPVAVEALVYSDRFYYGGRFDAVADLGDGRRWLLDWKTGKGVWPEACLQLNAYAFASHYVRPEDSVDVPMEDLGIEAAGVVWVRPTSWELVPVSLDMKLEYGTFLSAQSVWRWKNAGDGRHVYPPLAKPEGAAQ
jgi:hypothetical protein